jgi:hypothetical protein
MQPDFSQIGPFVLAAVVVLAVYRRLRRSFGRQALRPVRMTVRIVLLAVVACALAPMALQSAGLLTAELAGAAHGIGLGVWGAPHAPQIAEGTDPSQAFAATSMVKNPLTVGIFFVLVGYYGWYYSWLLWKSKHLNAADIDAAPVVTTP